MNMMSEQVNELFAALSKAQAVIQPALKDKANPFFKSKYCDLASVWNACREPLTNNGLCVMQTVVKNESGMVLITTLGHSSGQYIKSEMPLLIVKQDPQSLGSALTYSRRQSLAAIVGVAPDDDDDGERAQQGFRRDNVQLKQSNVQVNDDNIHLKPNVPLISSDEVLELLELEKQVDDECKTNSKKYMNEKIGVDQFAKLNRDQYRVIKYGFTANLKKKQELVNA